jgi:hypothetical protein
VERLNTRDDDDLNQSMLIDGIQASAALRANLLEGNTEQALERAGKRAGPPSQRDPDRRLTAEHVAANLFVVQRTPLPVAARRWVP